MLAMRIVIRIRFHNFPLGPNFEPPENSLTNLGIRHLLYAYLPLNRTCRVCNIGMASEQTWIFSDLASAHSCAFIPPVLYPLRPSREDLHLRNAASQSPSVDVFELPSERRFSLQLILDVH